jgi:DNA-binding NarL/FixJ family response regulator
MNEVKRVIIVDDHPIALKGFSVIVETVPTLKVVAEAHNAQEAINKVIAMKPDIAIIDIEMNRDTKDGFDIAREICEKGFTGTIIFLTHLEKKHSYKKFLNLDTEKKWGYIIKNDSPEEIIEGIKIVASGEQHISREMLKRFGDNHPPLPSGMPHLTPREVEVLDSLGYSTDKEIARRLEIKSHRVVEKHLQNLREKLALKNRDELRDWWLENRSHYVHTSM